MSLRPPQNLTNGLSLETGQSVLEAEMLAETASSLGHHGRKAEKALAALALASDKNRAELTDLAAREVWAYFIQRELCGMRDHRIIIREMSIPKSVLNRMGASGPTKRSR